MFLKDATQHKILLYTEPCFFSFTFKKKYELWQWKRKIQIRVRTGFSIPASLCSPSPSKNFLENGLGKNTCPTYVTEILRRIKINHIHENLQNTTKGKHTYPVIVTISSPHQISSAASVSALLCAWQAAYHPLPFAHCLLPRQRPSSVTTFKRYWSVPIGGRQSGPAPANLLGKSIGHSIHISSHSLFKTDIERQDGSRFL